LLFKQVGPQGYDLATGHRLHGITALAAPIENYSFPAALCLVGLESRLSLKINAVIELVKQSADQVSRHLEETNRDEKA
jgi:DNA-binding IclR family transcriptional regulator